MGKRPYFHSFMNRILNFKTVYNANSHNLHKDFEKNLYNQFVIFDLTKSIEDSGLSNAKDLLYKVYTKYNPVAC